MSVIASIGIGGAISAATAVIGLASSASASRSAAKTQAAANAANAASTERQMALAEDQWRKYKETYAPLEDSVAQEARGVGSQANREQAAGEAQAGVTSSLAGLRQQLQSTPGLDPSSARYLDAQARLGMREAAQGAQGSTAARSGVSVLGQAKLHDAAAIGSGLAGESSIAMSNASRSAASLGQAAEQQQEEAMRTAGMTGQAIGDFVNRPQVKQFIGGLFN